MVFTDQRLNVVKIPMTQSRLQTQGDASIPVAFLAEMKKFIWNPEHSPSPKQNNLEKRTRLGVAMGVGAKGQHIWSSVFLPSTSKGREDQGKERGGEGGRSGDHTSISKLTKKLW